MSLNPFADGLNNNYSTFIVKNNNLRKTVKVMGINIAPGNSYNLMSLPGVTEADIKVSLLKGVLKRKLALGEISITSSDLDLSTLNDSQLSFLQNSSINYGVLPTGGLYKIIYPNDDGTDDASQIMTALNSSAYKYTIVLSPINKNGARANFLIKSRITVPSGSNIIGLPGTVIKSTITPDSSPQNAVFWATLGTGVASTLAATPTVGSSSISVNADICAINDYILIQTGLIVATYKVIAKSGVGPFTYTLERPIVFTAFASGNDVRRVVSLPRDITIDGNGMLVSGTATRLFQFSGSHNVHLKNINIDATYGMATDLVCSFDVGGWFNSFENVNVDCNGVGTEGLALESQERSLITNCTIRKASAYGIVAYDSVFCDVVSCKTFLCNGGFVFTADGNVIGSLSCRAINCEAYNSTASGFTAINGSSRCQFIGCSAKYNATGIVIGDPGSTVMGSIIDSCDLSNNATGYAQGGTTRNSLISNIDTSGCTAYGININSGSDASISGWTHNGAMTGGNSILISAGSINITNARIVTTNAALNTFVISGGVCNILNSYVSSPAGSNMINAQAGVVKVAFTVLTGGGIGLYVNGGTIRRGEHNDFSGCTAQVTYSSGQINEGIVVLNGSTPVAVAFTDMKTTDKVTLFRTTNGGTPGINPLVTINNGVGFSVTGAALDTSTYTYRII